MSYEGMMLTSDDPSIRIMLIGNRVPPNIRRALDHHGIAWQEISVSSLVTHLKSKGDLELLSLLSPEELDFTGQELIRSNPEKHELGRSKPGRISSALVPEGYSEALVMEQVRQLFAEKYIVSSSQKRIYLNSARTFKLWANYIAALLLDREAAESGRPDRSFEPREIKDKLKEIMPYHYGKVGAKEGSLLTADVKIGSKYNLGFPCIEIVLGTTRYRFVGFKE